MKRTALIAAFAIGFASGFAVGEAHATSGQALSPKEVTEIATAIIQHGDGCAVFDAIRGMDRQLALTTLNDIVNVGQNLSPGSMAVTTIDGDPDNILVALNFVDQKTKTRNVVVHYTVFSKAHPTVDESNSACSF